MTHDLLIGLSHFLLLGAFWYLNGVIFALRSKFFLLRIYDRKELKKHEGYASLKLGCLALYVLTQKQSLLPRPLQNAPTYS